MRRFYEFGPFRLDADSRLLLRGGDVVPLKQKAVETLLVLIEGRGALLEKDELMRRLWPDTFVDESNLTQNIYVLRKAFGDAEYIETIPRRGYRFVGDVREHDDAALVVEERTRSSITIEEESRTRRAPIVAVTAIVVAALAGIALYRVQRGTPEPAVKSMAVLPFRSLAGADEAMETGLADALITNLSAGGSLVVRPTSAVLRYAKQDPLSAGRELGVDSVLDGSIQREHDRVRITVRLLRTSDGHPLWAGQFDERATDLFKLQDSIAQKVTGALAIRQLARRTTMSPDAYRLVLEGRYFWNKRTKEGFDKSIALFQKAIEIDPSYALAYSGLADAYLQLPAYGGAASMEIYPNAKAAAAKALELDDSLAEAHNSAAGVLSYFEWNWRAAEEEYRKAIALNPNYASAHHRLGVQLAAMKRPHEAVAELERAQELDPLSLIINALLGFAYSEDGQTDRAIAQLRKTIEMDRHFPPPHEFLMYVYRSKGIAAEEFREAMEWRRLSGDDPALLASYERAYAQSGTRGFYRERLPHTRFSEAAGLHALLGDKEEALDALEHAVEQHDGEVVWMATHPDLVTLRADPRFIALLKRAHLPTA